MKTSRPSFAHSRWAARLDGGARDDGRRCCRGHVGCKRAELRAAAAESRGAEEDATSSEGRRPHGSSRCNGSKEDDDSDLRDPWK
ncbi:hypothetical protein PAHAL_5G274700 [Panicum hallii]|uniref:Uncharacterized protein n=1 Tax=Panicum hallii TaxID=206008 RepID=A0A2T8ILG8_9POAL|nr:hypothetical protein PAHAL_5G274700 [Panicum hallii]